MINCECSMSNIRWINGGLISKAGVKVRGSNTEVKGHTSYPPNCSHGSACQNNSSKVKDGVKGSTKAGSFLSSLHHFRDGNIRARLSHWLMSPFVMGAEWADVDWPWNALLYAAGARFLSRICQRCIISEQEIAFQSHTSRKRIKETTSPQKWTNKTASAGLF